MENRNEPNLSLYDRLGGKNGIQSAVELFYGKIKDDSKCHITSKILILQNLWSIKRYSSLLHPEVRITTQAKA